MSGEGAEAVAERATASAVIPSRDRNEGDHTFWTMRLLVNAFSMETPVARPGRERLPP